MYVYGELTRAQLEVASSYPSAGVKARVGYNETTRQAWVDTGTLIVPIGSGGGSGLVWSIPDTNAPVPITLNGLELFDFDYLSTQEVYALLKVPDNYAAGNQIKITGGCFGTIVTTGNIFFKSQSSLIKAASTVIDTYTNQRTSTNAQITAAGVASRVTAIGDLDLTDSSGLVNAVAVAAGDQLLVRLYRDVASESASAAADARLLKGSFELRFS